MTAKYRNIADGLDDTAFAKALKERPWRNAAAPSAEPAVPPASPTAPVVTTSSTTTPPPPAAHKATKPALAMSPAEFDQAMKTKAWRNT